MWKMQTVVIDARAHMLGRLASIVAKEALSGKHVVSYRGLLCRTSFCRKKASAVAKFWHYDFVLATFHVVPIANDGLCGYSAV